MKTRSLLALLILTALPALVAACGDGDSGSDLAGLAPPGSVVFAEGEVRPSGETKSNADSLARAIAGVDNLGEFVVSELESSAKEDGEPFDYAEEVEPWLGERAAVAFQRLEDGDLSDPIAILESTDAEAAQAFIERRVEVSDESYEQASYAGVDYVFGGSDGDAIGVVGDFLVLSKGEQPFEAAVDASGGEALGDQERFASAIAAASDASLADVYVDVGGLIEQGGGGIDPQIREVLQNAGIDPSDATAVASVIPGEGTIEVELSSDLGGQDAPSGDASELLGSLPPDSFAAFAVSGFGAQLRETLDTLDEEGIPGQVPPNQLKDGLGEAGVDIDSIAGSLDDAAAFAVGRNEPGLGGALVLTAEDSKAQNAISNLGLLLRGAGVSGITALSGQASGFSVRSPELGGKPLVVAARDERIAIGYGMPATLRALAPGAGRTLADTATFEAAVEALGEIPIGGFADGPAALRLANSLVPGSDEGFAEARRYLRKVEFVALGTSSDGDLATARLVVGIEE